MVASSPHPLAKIASSTITNVAPGGGQSYQQQHQSHHLLPPTFVPGSNDIIMGRSSGGRKASGNIHLKWLLMTYLKQYNRPKDTLEKTVLTYHVVMLIKDRGGKFVKQRKEDKRWEEISEEEARQKVSLDFRNLRRGHQRHVV